MSVNMPEELRDSLARLADASGVSLSAYIKTILADAAKVANWSRHTNAAQLYKSYVARLVSREEAGRFVEIVPR